MALVAIKLSRMDSAKKREVADKTLSRSVLKIFLDKERKDPLAPNPRKAILTTKKAKWYCCVMLKYRVKEISKHRIAEEIKKIPK
jgi:hypothetical protein